MKSLAPAALLAVLGLVGTAGAATPGMQLMATIQQFVDSFNKGDAKAAAATLTPGGVVIIDDVAPHLWSGASAFDAWGKALADADQKQGNTDQAVALGKPTRVIVEADRGYVVVPTVYTFESKGVAMREPAQMTVALQKGAAGWQIAGFAWAGTKPRPVDTAR
jgi:hypothetical protein